MASHCLIPDFVIQIYDALGTVNDFLFLIRPAAPLHCLPLLAQLA